MNALALCVLGFVLAQDPLTTFVLKNGQHLTGNILRLEGDRAVLRISIEGGWMEVTRTLDQFQPQSAYRIVEQTSKSDGVPERLRLAEFAMDNGLIWAAKRDLETARKLSGQASLAPELAKKIDEKGASILEGLFRQELSERGNVQKARRLVSELMIRYPDTEAASRKDALFAFLDKEEQRIATEKKLAEVARADAKLEEQRGKVVTPIETHLAAGVAENRQGLLTSRHLAEGNQHFVNALGHYRSAQRAVTDALAKAGNDKVLAEKLGQLGQKANSASTDALLNAGSLALVRGQLGPALGYVNNVLALDPSNSDARAMRARIEIAANRGGGYTGY